VCVHIFDIFICRQLWRGVPRPSLVRPRTNRIQDIGHGSVCMLVCCMRTILITKWFDSREQLAVELVSMCVFPVQYFCWFNGISCRCWSRSRSRRHFAAICTFLAVKERLKVSHKQVAIFSFLLFFPLLSSLIINKHLFYLAQDPCLCKLCVCIGTSSKLLSLKIISISFRKSIKDIYTEIGIGIIKCRISVYFGSFLSILFHFIRR